MLFIVLNLNKIYSTPSRAWPLCRVCVYRQVGCGHSEGSIPGCLVVPTSHSPHEDSPQDCRDCTGSSRSPCSTGTGPPHIAGLTWKLLVGPSTEDVEGTPLHRWPLPSWWSVAAWYDVRSKSTTNQCSLHTGFIHLSPGFIPRYTVLKFHTQNAWSSVISCTGNSVTCLQSSLAHIHRLETLTLDIWHRRLNAVCFASDYLVRVRLSTYNNYYYLSFQVQPPRS